MLGPAAPLVAKNRIARRHPATRQILVEDVEVFFVFLGFYSEAYTDQDVEDTTAYQKLKRPTNSV